MPGWHLPKSRKAPLQCRHERRRGPCINFLTRLEQAEIANWCQWESSRHRTGHLMAALSFIDCLGFRRIFDLMVETRIAPRYRVSKAGTIEFIGGTIDCVVRNLSVTGAALEVSNQTGIPE